MKKIYSCIVLFALMSFLLFGCIPEIEDFEYYFNSTFEIICSEEGKADSAGTAFKFQNYLVTNAHVLTYKEDVEYLPYSSISIKDSFGGVQEFNLISFDRYMDIAILSPKESRDFEKIPNFKFSNSYSLGEEIFTIGNTNGYGLSLTKGCVSANEKKFTILGKENNYIQTSLVISKGNSGAPVCNMQGELLGMMTFKLRDQNGEYIEGMSFMIPSTVIAQYIKEIN